MAKIVIIDDDVECAAHAATILKSKNHEILMVHSTEKAVDFLVREKPDLLVLDVMFPNNPVAGFDLAREVRGCEPIRNLPIILLTSVNQEFPMGFSNDDIDSDWMPIQKFLEKPVKSAELLKAVAKLLG